MAEYKKYSKVDTLPKGNAGGGITEGTLVLEGGAWRGIYTQGALDALMEAGINFRTTIGVSAGAMSGIGYLSGQIGYTGRINLSYRNDPNYVGRGALRIDHGVTGFSYLFNHIMKIMPLDQGRFNDPARRFIVVATNMETGWPEYFEKGKCRIFRAIRASATVPYVSRPVVIDGHPYLDGGCSVKIPYDWAIQNEWGDDALPFDAMVVRKTVEDGDIAPVDKAAEAEDSGQTRKPGKIMVIRTQCREYRHAVKTENTADRILYRKYPDFIKAMVKATTDYNVMCDRLAADEADGKIFVQAPKDPVNLERFEGDVEKLGAQYFRGYNEMRERIPELKAYLGGDQ